MGKLARRVQTIPEKELIEMPRSRCWRVLAHTHVYAWNTSSGSPLMLGLDVLFGGHSRATGGYSLVQHRQVHSTDPCAVPVEQRTRHEPGSQEFGLYISGAG